MTKRQVTAEGAHPPKPRAHHRNALSIEWLKPVDIDHGIGKGLRCFLQQIVPHVGGDQPMLVLVWVFGDPRSKANMRTSSSIQNG